MTAQIHGRGLFLNFRVYISLSNASLWLQRQESNLRPRAYEARDLTVCPLCNRVVCPTVKRLSALPRRMTLCHLCLLCLPIVGGTKPPGAPSETRTPDQCLKRALLYQLS